MPFTLENEGWRWCAALDSRDACGVNASAVRPEQCDLVVFSHPNHELAIFGLLQRWRPSLVYLTDGGGSDRVAETRIGLESIGLLERATFLNHAENLFYRALLDRDVDYLERVSDEVARVIETTRPSRVLCDAVEHYNPVHDLSLPIVLRALRRAGPTTGDTPVFEVPLIHQVQSAKGEVYAVQRPAATGPSDVWLELTPDEVAAKRTARSGVYTLLAAQLGPIIGDLSDDHLAREVVIPAGSPTRHARGVLRYEWRAERLRAEGTIERAITFEEHFLPVASSLDQLPAAAD
jgi:hypothetical protein